MADKGLTDLLFAFSLGCLDDDNKKKLREYLKSNNDYPLQELGEHQNLVALLPIILEIENPTAELKDKVARNLYQVQEELKSKIANESTDEIDEPEVSEEESSSPATDSSGIKFREGRIEPPTPPAEDKFEKNEIIEPSGELTEDKTTDEPSADQKLKIQSYTQMPQPPLPPPPPPSGKKDFQDGKVKRDKVFEATEPEKFRLTEAKKPEENIPIQNDEVEEKDKAPWEREAKDGTAEFPKAPEIINEEIEDKNTEPADEPFKMPNNFSVIKEDAPVMNIGESMDLDMEEPGNLAEPEIEKKGLQSQRPVKEEEPFKSEVRPYNKFIPQEAQPEKRRTGSLIPLLIILALIIAAGYYFYHNLSSEISKYQTQIDYLNKEVSDLKNQAAGNSNTENLLNSQNSKTVILKPTPNHVQGSGRLIINLQNNKGYMQLLDMPPLDPNRAYQLWMITQGKVISLGVFNPVNNKSSNYPFSIPHIADTQNINFVLTIEPSTGSESPSRSVFLTGSIQ